MSDMLETENSGLVLQLAPNGDEIKVSKLIGGRRWSRPLLHLNADTLRRRSKRVRDTLSMLTEYLRRHSTSDGSNVPKFDEQKDPGWIEYTKIVRELQSAGDGLRNAFLPDSDQSTLITTEIAHLARGANLTVHCTDGDVTLPLGFIYEGQQLSDRQCPQRAHFHGFWVCRFRITLLIQNGGCDNPDDLKLDPSQFLALYALHREEFERAIEALAPEYREKLKRLISLPLREYYDWSSATRAWDEAECQSNVVFILAHSDGDILELADSTLDSGSFAKRFRRPAIGPATLLLLNCCLSAAGARGDSLLSVVGQQGFSGLIGTEAEILNTHALRCGTRLLWDLCAEGLSLGRALELLQQDDDPDIFPANLFYTCYADRDFALRAPIKDLRS